MVHRKANRRRTSPSSIVVSQERPSGGMMHVSPPNLKLPPTLGSMRDQPQNQRDRCSIRSSLSKTVGRGAAIRMRNSYSKAIRSLT